MSISPNCWSLTKANLTSWQWGRIAKKSVDNTLDSFTSRTGNRTKRYWGSLHFASLEKISSKNVYIRIRSLNKPKTWDAACAHIDDRLTLYPTFIREVTKEDILSSWNKDGSVSEIQQGQSGKISLHVPKEQIEENKQSQSLSTSEYTTNWFKMLKEKWRKRIPRRTELQLDTIEVQRGSSQRELYTLTAKKDSLAPPWKRWIYCQLFDIDDVIIFYRDGRYLITPVAEKKFIGKNVLYINIFKKTTNEPFTTWCTATGKRAFIIETFAVIPVTRDREYDLDAGNARIVVYFTAKPQRRLEANQSNPLETKPAYTKKSYWKDFQWLQYKGKPVHGNILLNMMCTKLP